MSFWACVQLRSPGALLERRWLPVPPAWISSLFWPDSCHCLLLQTGLQIYRAANWLKCSKRDIWKVLQYSQNQFSEMQVVFIVCELWLLILTASDFFFCQQQVRGWFQKTKEATKKSRCCWNKSVVSMLWFVRYFKTQVQEKLINSAVSLLKSGHFHLSKGTEKLLSCVVREQIWLTLLLPIHLWLSWPVINHLRRASCQAVSQNCRAQLLKPSTLRCLTFQTEVPNTDLSFLST